MVNEIYPSKIGNLVIGKYYHQNIPPQELLSNKDRQPFLVIELLNKKWYLRAAQPTRENALLFCGSENRWLVHPYKENKD